MSEPQNIAWHSPKDAPFQVAGFGWWDTDCAYRRLPVKAPETLPEVVDRLANWTSGGQIRFQTDSREVWVRVTLADVADMNHMPATGQCGFDCYLGPPGEQRFVGVTKYDHHQVQYEQALFSIRDRSMRHVTLNFPLYMGVKEVLVGIEQDADVQPPLLYDSDGRIVIYGSSITQGGCAARPGMSCSNIISRRINREFINVGFSGSGRGEPEVARTIATIERPALFVLDYEANCGEVERLRETFPEFIRILREAHPTTPVLGVSRFIYATEFLDDEQKRLRLERKEIQRATIQTLRTRGDENVHFVDGERFLGGPGAEGTVDGVHPTDLGFLRLADAMTPVIQLILGKS